MEKNSRIKTVLLIVLIPLLCVPFASCTKDNGDGGSGSNDNTGIEFRMRNQANGYDGICFFDCFGELFMSAANNFHCRYCDIASIGPVSGLSRIKKIPDSGWVYDIAVHPGYGYVIRFFDEENDVYHYARVYVEDWIESTGGGIIGALLWYEDNWR